METKMMKEFTIAFLALICAACASTADPTAESGDEKLYRTGSNLPVRERNGPSDAKSVDPASIQDMRNRTGGSSSTIRSQ
jgi:hypothetical protein